ncbi:hypothetical protein BpHYR1_028023 [Brachionus plicatilis]|uniref:Uncharacterized protein n=1 Tax=Brachionus plicatilis TaxID=10195 RepID=A0A3M7QYL6_BRAPC|nr:hypothetical protein BpHYR1_028023 [Brachionus plicatilis]
MFQFQNLLNNFVYGDEKSQKVLRLACLVYLQINFKIPNKAYKNTYGVLIKRWSWQCKKSTQLTENSEDIEVKGIYWSHFVNKFNGFIIPIIYPNHPFRCKEPNALTTHINADALSRWPLPIHDEKVQNNNNQS